MHPDPSPLPRYMSQPPKSASRIVSRAKLSRTEQRRSPIARLNAAMPCDTAFRIIARRHLENLLASHQATCDGDPDGLHEMRISLTYLRAVIRLFSPMLDDAERPQIWRELKWLNAELGSVRDLDVALHRMRPLSPKRQQTASHLALWNERCTEGHRRLTRSLQSPRFRRLVEDTSAWIATGPWSTKAGKKAAEQRTSPVGQYGARKLARWQRKLIGKHRRLREMDARRRHRLRLLNKRLTYAIESFSELLGDKEFSKQKAALKPLRKAQKCLGQLNDDVNSHALELSLRKRGIAVRLHRLGRKREKLLLCNAEAAYRKLAALKPFRN